MGEPYKVWSRAPGTRFATLVDARGRRSTWFRVNRTQVAWFACSVCGQRIRVDEPAWKRQHAGMGSTGEMRKERICAPCLDRLAAAGTGGGEA